MGVRPLVRRDRWGLVLVMLVAAAAVGGSCTPKPPDAPVLSGLSATHDSVSGSVSACTVNGNPMAAGACSQRVRVVASGGGCNAAPLAETSVPETGGPFSIGGLSPGTDYTVYGIAERVSNGSSTCSAPGAISTNGAPAAPVLSNITATGSSSASISGSITACQDDGLPVPPGACTQEVMAFSEGVTCTSTCSCTGVPAGSGPATVTNGTWSVTVLDPQTTYVLYGRSYDGFFETCSAPVTKETPLTRADCVKHDMAMVHTITPGFLGGVGPRGARATWTVRQPTADDWQFDGFAQQGLWISIDDSDLSTAWIETGVTRGFHGQNLFTYFYATGDNRTGAFEDVLITSATPVAGTAITFKIVNCQIYNPGCPPWNQNTSPLQWVACRSEYECTTIDLNGSGYSGVTRQYMLGGESTCGPPSRIDKTWVRDIQFRAYGSYWSNASNMPPSSHFIGTNPPPSAIHDIACCTSTIVDGDQTYCSNPNMVRYWLNSQIPTTGCFGN